MDGHQQGEERREERVQINHEKGGESPESPNNKWSGSRLLESFDFRACLMASVCREGMRVLSFFSTSMVGACCDRSNAVSPAKSRTHRLTPFAINNLAISVLHYKMKELGNMCVSK